MLLMICGIVIALITINTGKLRNLILGLLVGVILAHIGVFVPIHGYKEPIFQNENELSSIHAKLYSDEPIYAIVDSNGFVTCKHGKEDDSYKAAMYTYETNVEFEYVDDKERPVLIEYLLEPKTSILSMAVGAAKTKHVIYCPKNYIEIWQNKHIE